MKDTYKHKGLRRELAKNIRAKGIKDERVIEAIKRVPRHFFFENIFDAHAYQDKAFPIDSGQTISSPYTVAFQTEKLGVESGSKILEIGTGSGYQACVLIELGARVYSIEYQKALYLKAIRFLPQIGYQPHLYHGDGSEGMPRHAPYDGIIVTAGAPAVPRELIDQLKIGGKLIIPVGDEKSQAMQLIEKREKNRIRRIIYDQFNFVPLLGKNGRYPN